MGDAVRYDADFYAWTQDQARVLREAAAARVNVPLDWSNLAEEVADMGSSKVDAAQSALVRILEPLLKLEHAPARFPRGGWRRSVIVHRDRLSRTLDQSPSIVGRLDVERGFGVARKLAAEGLRHDRLAAGELPAACPYSLAQLRDETLWPANRHGIKD